MEYENIRIVLQCGVLDNGIILMTRNLSKAKSTGNSDYKEADPARRDGINSDSNLCSCYSISYVVIEGDSQCLGAQPSNSFYFLHFYF